MCPQTWHYHPNEVEMGCTRLPMMAGTQMHQLGAIIAEYEQFHEELECQKMRTRPDLGGSEEGANLETLGIGLVGIG